MVTSSRAVERSWAEVRNYQTATRLSWSDRKELEGDGTESAAVQRICKEASVSKAECSRQRDGLQVRAAWFELFSAWLRRGADARAAWPLRVLVLRVQRAVAGPIAGKMRIDAVAQRPSGLPLPLSRWARWRVQPSVNHTEPPARRLKRACRISRLRVVPVVARTIRTG